MSVSFGSHIDVTPGNTYWIVAEGGSSSTDLIIWWQATNVYSGGNKRDGKGDDLPNDMFFVTYYDDTQITEFPSAIGIVMLAFIILPLLTSIMRRIR